MKTKAVFVHKYSHSAYIETKVTAFGVKNSKIIYNIYPNGKINISYEAVSTSEMLRFGLKFTLNKEFDFVKWYGRGPHETYCDRRTGGKIAKHELSVNDLEHHYMRPQENGQRTDVREMEISSSSGNSVKFKMCNNTPFCFTAHHYTVNDLDKATHIHSLKEKDLTEVCIDLMQRGVGGDAPGNSCLRDPYIMHKNTKFAYSFTMELK